MEAPQVIYTTYTFPLDEDRTGAERTATLKIACVAPSEHNRLCRSDATGFGSVCHTGLRVYDGSAVIAEFILRKGQCFLPGRRVLELGCGCGLCGLSALLQHPSLVVFSDGQAKCLDLVLRSVEANHGAVADDKEGLFCWRVAVDSACHAAGTAVSWDDTAAVARLAAAAGLFDVIIGAELCYFFVDLGALLRAAAALLSRDVGVALFAHVNRIPNGQQLFRLAARTAGLVVVTLPDTVVPTSVVGVERWLVAHHLGAISSWLNGLSCDADTVARIIKQAEDEGDLYRASSEKGVVEEAAVASDLLPFAAADDGV